MSLKERLLKTSTLEHTDVLSESEIYGQRLFVPTPVPMLNVALSGSIGGGVSSGITTIAGPSRHFKTAFALVMAASYLKAHEDAVVLFYDSEFGSPADYFASVGIDPSRVIHCPIVTIEELRHDISVQLAEIKRNEKVIVVIDSLGNLASAKETNDAIEGNDKADLTRAKVNKSLFRIITPQIRLKNIPAIIIQHTYDTIEIHSRQQVSGGTGTIYSSDTILVIGRRQDKVQGGPLLGYEFIINIEKSRFVREKLKIPITVGFNGGIQKWSGLFDIAVAAKFIVQKNKVWYYSKHDPLETPFKKASVNNNGEFWKAFLKDTDLAEFIKTAYSLPAADLMSEDVAAPSEEVETLDFGLVDDQAEETFVVDPETGEISE